MKKPPFCSTRVNECWVVFFASTSKTVVHPSSKWYQTFSVDAGCNFLKRFCKKARYDVQTLGRQREREREEGCEPLPLKKACMSPLWKITNFSTLYDTQPFKSVCVCVSPRNWKFGAMKGEWYENLKYWSDTGYNKCVHSCLYVDRISEKALSERFYLFSSLSLSLTLSKPFISPCLGVSLLIAITSSFLFRPRSP